MSNKLEQLEFKLEKNIEIQKHAGKVSEMILPYFSDEEHDGPSSTSPNQLTSEQIRTTLSPAAEEKNVKLIVRHQRMHFKSPLRSQMWKALYLRMEGKF